MDFVTQQIAQKLKEKRVSFNFRVIKQRGEPIIYDLPKKPSQLAKL